MGHSLGRDISAAASAFMAPEAQSSLPGGPVTMWWAWGQGRVDRMKALLRSIHWGGMGAPETASPHPGGPSAHSSQPAPATCSAPPAA